MSRGLTEPVAKAEGEGSEPAAPDMDDPRIERAMMDLERDMEHLDENNPKHMAHMMRKMKDLMPPGSIPKELDVAIQTPGGRRGPRKNRGRLWAMCLENLWAARKKVTRRRRIRA